MRSDLSARLHPRSVAHIHLGQPPGTSPESPSGKIALVRIHDGQGNEINDVYVALTDDEAKQLIDWLNELVATRQRGAHWHVSETVLVSEREGRIVNELTVYRADDDSAVF